MCRERELEGRQRAFERQQQQAPYYPPHTPPANVPPYYAPPYVTPSAITPSTITPTITPSTITTAPTVGNSRFTAPVTMATTGKKTFHLAVANTVTHDEALYTFFILYPTHAQGGVEQSVLFIHPSPEILAT